MVLGSTLGMSHLSNSMPISRSIQGNAFSWPTATKHVVAGKMLVRLAARHQAAPALGVVLRLHLLEQHAGQAAVLVGEFLGHEEIVDRDVLVHGVLLLPGGRLHLLEAGTHHDLDVLAAEPARGAAAVHGGVAAAQHDDAAADLGDMAEGDRRQPVDADMDVGGGFLAAGKLELAPARRAGADEDRVPAPGHEGLEAVDALAAHELDAEIEDVVALFVDDGFRQPEARDLRADHAAGLGVLVEHGAVIADGGEIAGDGERSGTAPDQRDALAVLVDGGARQPGADVFLVVGGDALEAADGDRILLDPPAPASRLARPVAGAPEDAREHVRFPIDHVGVAVATRRDHANIFGHRRVRRARPLAIHDLVEIIRRSNVGRFH